MDFGLKGRTALVLGAGGGLGRAIAVALVQEGANVALADIEPETLKESTAAVEAAGGTALALVWDFADLGSIESTMA